MPRSNVRRIVAVMLVVVVCAGALIALRGAGRWLVRQDALEPADLIVVLSGSMPTRAEEAADIFRQGYAKEIWVSRPAGPREDLESMGIHYVGEEDYNRAILIHEGVPEADVKVFPVPIINTEQEIEEVSGQMRHEGKTSVIIVTSYPHTRRVRTLWRQLAGDNLRMIVRGAPGGAFDRDHWWRNSRDVFAVVREYLGLLNAWLGLPARPLAE
jgi:uncharacterized SAM-binding protein YcdF (DUF218 family)